ncbi:hypothetical protein [Amphritea sp. HPY]|uniref:hypothetical protein n=1 Tax=Amphritea sp. HPY TaxID=3421652 RepID=UPI003D7EC6D0
MELIAIIVFALACMLIAPKLISIKDERKKYFFDSVFLYGGSIVIIFVCILTSFVFIEDDETGHMFKIYTGGNLKYGSIIAVDGEKGPQAEILPPGFHFRPFLNILYDIKVMDVIEIPSGKYGFLMARDGQPLRPDQTFADAFISGETSQRLYDAAYFLKNGGQKGPQTSVLTPGKHRLNKYLWDVTFKAVTEIPKGFVGVIKSNVHSRVDFGNLKTDRPRDCSPISKEGIIGVELEVPLVPVGCIGIWERALNPGKYYINRSAYHVTLIDTRVQTWEYRGGFSRRRIDLTVDQQGRISQSEHVEYVKVPSKAVDEAVFLKIEGWTVAQQLRVLVQVTPRLAPFVIASVGGLKEVENRIMSPSVQSIVRNVAGGFISYTVPVLDKYGEEILDETGNPKTRIIHRRTQVLDVIERRAELEANIEETIKVEGVKAGVDIKEVRLLEPDLPPELLVARKREQLAQQLAKSYNQERLAQDERIKTERARATADKQPNLVEAEIEVKRSEQFAIARLNEGKGERDKLSLIATGQKEQAQVLGEDRVVELRKFEVIVSRIFDLFENHPDILTTGLTNAHKFVPDRVFSLGGEQGNHDLAAAAGILGDFLGGSRPNQSDRDGNLTRAEQQRRDREEFPIEP